MSNKKFEKLIEYVINDEEDKAKELFHQIVVEKSREIYEGLMDDEFDGSSEDTNFIDNIQSGVEADEEGFDAEDDEFGAEDEFDDEGEDEFGADEDFGAEDDDTGLEDRLVDVEDKLDELIAEFEALSNDDSEFDTETDADEEFGAEDEFDAEGEDEFGADADEEFGAEDEFDAEGEDEFGADDEDNMNEAVSLTSVAKPANTDVADNKKSVTLQNSGKAGVGKGGNPVKFSGDAAETGRKAPSTKELGVNGPEAAAKGAFKTKAPAAKVSESKTRTRRSK